MQTATSVEDHIAGFAADIKERLEKLRTVIKKAAPGAEETISYGIPTFKLNGNLVHFAGYKNHIGFYPGAAGIENFSKELKEYETSKGTVQFPHDKKIPYALITQIVKFRVAQNKEKAATKKKTVKQPLKIAEHKDVVAVKEWMEKLLPADQKEINAIRKIIKAASPLLQERIKWNAPSYYTTTDLLTFGPYKNKTILLVFHHPAIVKIKSVLLEGNYKDRRLMKFSDAAAVKKEQKELTRVIQELVKLAAKK